jgi:hypothetical protein
LGKQNFVEGGNRLGLGKLSVDVESKDRSNESQRQDKDDNGITNGENKKKESNC